ncbi:MAG: Gfo/Idh/MocA family oxidoreductase [Melioribacteraceae bacterium]|nr:Gfo/Idh/MocA family oxidoreductase [Melioribacteraceae bacterium]MCF8263129.1 Gfo/Idh/MocA family oxidoreductase [Melioribacteraceae bacterium]MCF8430539.1 Gfo/Idh/MocA family oxidoreductase [Melioribacteraceae bacterium]
MSSIKRRDFISSMGLAGIGLSVAPNLLFGESKTKFRRSNPNGKVNIAFIGVGLRGRNHVNNISRRDDVEITAICDIDKESLAKTQKILNDYSRPEATEYSGDEYSFMKLLERDDVDGVIISTPWLWHTRMAVASMKAGKFAGVEVSAANTLEECWDLVNTSEETGIPCMILENVCFAREAMAALKMVREGVFGELVHSTCGYRHDLRGVKFNDGKQPYGGGVEFGEKGFSEAKWRTEHSLKRNGDIYPTHGIGPVATWFDINRGNRFVSLTSTATKSIGLHNYIVNHPKGGENHPNAKLKWKLGDIITTVIKTAREETIIVTHDTNLPRPYSWGFTLHGANGVWNGQFEGKRLYLEGTSEPHQWTEAEEYDKIMKKYDHKLWTDEEKNAENSGHGGIDYFTAKAFVESVKYETQPPIDVYDAAAWSAITPLSEMSIANNSSPQYFPDFTRGRWMTNKPIFGI